MITDLETIYYIHHNIMLYFRDLLHQKINTFNTNVEKTLESTKTLMNQVHAIRLRYANSTTADATNRKEVLQIYFDKVDKLVSAADQIKIKFISLKENNDKLRDKIQSTDHMKDLLEL